MIVTEVESQKGKSLGRFLILFGVLLAVFGVFRVDGYDSSKGFMWNAENRTIELPFFRGEKPLSCLADSFRRVLPNPTGAAYKPEPGCYSATQSRLGTLLFVSLISVLLGAYLLFRDVKFGSAKDGDSKKNKDKKGGVSVNTDAKPKQTIDRSAGKNGGEGGGGGLW